MTIATTNLMLADTSAFFVSATNYQKAVHIASSTEAGQQYSVTKKNLKNNMTSKRDRCEAVIRAHLQDDESVRQKVMQKVEEWDKKNKLMATDDTGLPAALDQFREAFGATHNDPVALAAQSVKKVFKNQTFKLLGQGVSLKTLTNTLTGLDQTTIDKVADWASKYALLRRIVH